MRHALRRKYGRAAMAAGRVKWRAAGGAYTADGLWGSFTIFPSLSGGHNFKLVWENTHGYPYSDDESTHQELGSFKALAAAKKAAQAHINLLKSTAVG